MKKFILFIVTLFKSEKIVFAGYENEVMTIKGNYGSEKKYYGSGTVWRELTSMKRCNTSTEESLSRFYNFNKFYKTPYTKI